MSSCCCGPDPGLFIRCETAADGDDDAAGTKGKVQKQKLTGGSHARYVGHGMH